MVSRKQAMQNAREADPTCFVIYKDGKAEDYKTLKVITGVMISPYLLADGNIKIDGETIDAY